MVQRVLFACLVVVVAFVPLLHGDDAPPPWVSQLISSPPPEVDPKAPAVVLLDEGVVTVGQDGVVTQTTRWAVKILKREGRDSAVARQTYDTQSDKVKDMRAWLVRPGRGTKKYGKAETVDVALVANDVYNQARSRIISAEGDAEPDSFFAYESIIEDRSIFTQHQWFFQDTLPVVLSRFVVNVPAGWSAQGITFNRDEIPVVRVGDSYTWELRNLPYIELQPMMAPLINFVPRLAVSLFPGDGWRGECLRKSFSDWNQVGRWLWELSEPQVQGDASLSAKAGELTSGAKTEVDRIRAVAAFAQGIKYVSIQMGTGRGGGYQPHPAPEVLTKAYGDCKDKANLMRSLLRVLQIESFPVTVYAGERNFVRQEWPSPQQFNHAIIAVKVSGDLELPSVITHPQLGRLLIFDPTDEYTPLGDIPQELQGSLALVASKETRSLVRLPFIPEKNNRFERTVEATIGPGGQISAKIQERSWGQPAVRERRQYKSEQASEYTKDIEAWISGSLPGVSVSKIDCRDDAVDNRFEFDVQLSGERYGQMMQNLLIFRPSLLGRRRAATPTEGTRLHPIEINPTVFVETSVINLPAGFAVDEIPESVKLESSFGTYEASFEAAGNQMKLRRRLVLQAMILPPDKYPEVKGFYDRISVAEQSPAVLIRK